MLESWGAARSLMFGVPAVSSSLSREGCELRSTLRFKHCWPALYPPSICPRFKGSTTSGDCFCVSMNLWRFPVRRLAQGSKMRDQGPKDRGLGSQGLEGLNARPGSPGVVLLRHEHLARTHAPGGYLASLPCSCTVSIGARLGSPKVSCPAAEAEATRSGIIRVDLQRLKLERFASASVFSEGRHSIAGALRELCRQRARGSSERAERTRLSRNFPQRRGAAAVRRWVALRGRQVKTGDPDSLAQELVA